MLGSSVGLYECLDEWVDENLLLVRNVQHEHELF